MGIKMRATESEGESIFGLPKEEGVIPRLCVLHRVTDHIY